MSEIKVDSIGPRVDSGTLTIGAAGDTVNIAGTAGTGFPAGVSLSGSTNNTVATVTGANALIGEADLTFDGTNLDLPDNKKIRLGTGNDLEIYHDANNSYLKNNINSLISLSAGHYWRNVNDDSGTGMCIVSSNVGIGEETPLGKLHIKTGDSGGSVENWADELVIENGGAGTGMTFLSNNDQSQSINFGDAQDSNAGMIQYSQNSNHMVTHVNGAERMRILSGGEVIINRTSTFFGGNILQIVGKNDAEVVAIAVATNGKKAIQFANAGLSDVGNIVTSSSSVAYNTSSDYRLKENETPITDGITRLKTLKPYRFNWLADNDENGNPTQTVDGFFAHEVTAVPEAINGTKDAMHPEVLYTADDELPEGKEIGDVKEVAKPNHQSIDQSKLVPLLVASVQELIAENETLKTRITALENA